MTELKDIRAGNKVVFNRSGIVVTVLQVDNNQILLDTFPESSYYSNSHVSGIELTPLLLEKLSFTNDEEPTKWAGQGINIYMQQDGFFYGLRLSKSKAKIQYLHQLQNYIADFFEIFKNEAYTLAIPEVFT